MQERLAAGQVDLFHSERQRVVDVRAHRRAIHALVTVLLGAAGHETMGAGEIAE